MIPALSTLLLSLALLLPGTAWAQSAPQLQKVIPGTADGATATAGTTGDYSIGGVYDDTMANCASGKSCLVRITPARGLHLNLRNSSGTEVGTAGNPLRVDPTGVTPQPVSGAVSVTGSVTVSGTITANQGGSPWAMRLQDGAGGTLATITAGNALKVDGSGVTQPISGSVTANAGSGTYSNQQSNITLDYDTGAGTQSLTLWGLALPASGGAVAGGTAGNPLRTDPTGATTQPVSGTVAVSGPVAVTQSGAWSVRAQDGSGNALTSAARGAERALTVQIVDGSGAQVTTFGGAGGTASNYGSAFPASGTAVGFKDSAGINMAAGNLDASGNLKVNVAAGGGSGGTSSSFGAAFPATGTAGGLSDGTNMQAGRAIDTDSGAGTVYVQGVNLLKRASGGPVEAGTASDPLRIDPTGTTIQPISAASLPLPTGAATEASVDGLEGALGAAADAAATAGSVGSLSAKLRLITSQLDAISTELAQKTEPANTQTVTGAVTLSEYTPVSGRLPVDGSGVTQPVSMATQQPVGTVAHDGVDSGNPVKVGCHAKTASRTAVADADRADVLCDKNGKLVVTLAAARERVVRSGAISLSTTTETTLIAAGGAGVFRDLTYLKCTNGSATLVRIDLRDATAGTVIDHWDLAANGGGFNLALTPPYAQAAANNNWTVQLSGAVSTVHCAAQAVENN